MSTSPTSSALSVLMEAAREPWRLAAGWRAAGRRLVGYRCLYVPEELITAAGLLPFPLYGTPEPVRQADAYFQACTCELVRNLFDQALEEKLPRLDLCVLSNTCDAVRKLCDLWNAYLPGQHAHMINNPQKLLSENGRALFAAELQRFREHLEALAGRPVEEPALRAAIRLHNRVRERLRELYALREEDPPRLSGSEAFQIALGATVLPKEEALPLLEEVLEQVRQREPEESFGPRILVTGSILDSPALIEIVEEQGGLVVADDLCTTSRYFWHQADEAAEPMEALCGLLDRRVLCACMHPLEARLEHLLGLASRFRVEGVIDFTLKYCHPFLYEAPLRKRAMEARGLPTTVLEVGHDHSGHGQLRTRIQAFVEMLEARA
jgi:benzoyl-CoA reductase subunit C